MTPDITILYDTMRWEEKSLLEAGRRMGVNIQMIDCRTIHLRLEDTSPEYGTVLQRCLSHYRNVHSTAALEGMGCTVINPLMTSILAGNKLYGHMLLQRSGVPTPDATVAFSKDAALEGMAKRGYPVVLKPTVGSWGRMVSRINDDESAEGILEARDLMYPIYRVFYIEEYVRRPPRDIRAIVLGDSVAAAIYRVSGPGAWKTNTALGAKAIPCPVTGEIEDICIKASKAVGGKIVGVDLMESEEKGLVVHEVNNTTEYKNVARVCEKDISSLMLEYVMSVGGRQ